MTAKPSQSNLEVRATSQGLYQLLGRQPGELERKVSLKKLLRFPANVSLSLGS